MFTSRLHRHRIASVICALLVALVCAGTPTAAAAWGDEGHRVVAIIANRLLDPAVRTKIEAMLAADTDTLTAHDFASSATWADKYRDSDRNSTKVRYQQTRQWHFVDIELTRPDLDAACFQHPAPRLGELASDGPAQVCIVDKLNQFIAELSASSTPDAERLLALKFVLHLVGDLHQPLHAADNHDAGGNQKHISSGGMGARNLHGLWDNELVHRLGEDSERLAAALARDISDEKLQSWSKGRVADWAQESFEVARTRTYGLLPAPGPDGSYALAPEYVDNVVPDVGGQLSKAGVRLAYLLNKALGR